MVVIKLGGSLYDSVYLQEWLDVLAKQTTEVIVIVPGGGPFSEQIRTVDKRYSLPEEASHAMAVLGMQQYAHMLHGLQSRLRLISSIEDCSAITEPPYSSIWLPYEEVLKTKELLEAWQTTSDTISLWLAKKLQARKLVLIKSAEISNQSTTELVSSDIVDQQFQAMLKNFTGTVVFMHATESKQLNNIIST